MWEDACVMHCAWVGRRLTGTAGEGTAGHDARFEWRLESAVLNDLVVDGGLLLCPCRTRAPPARHPLTPSPRATRSRGARPAGGGEQTATSPAFGGDGFEFRVRLNLQPRVGRSVEISLLLEPASRCVSI